MIKFYYTRLLQVMQPKTQIAVTITSGNTYELDVAEAFVVRFSATAPVRYTLGDAFDAAACFRASDCTTGVRDGFAKMVFMADADTTLHIEVM